MKKLKVLLGALSLLTVGVSNAGTLVLDSFNYDPALNLSTNVGVGNTNASDTVTSAETGALAAYDLNYTSPDSGTAGASGNLVNVSDGELSYEESPGADGTLEIDYSLPGGASLDFSGYADFYFDVTFIDGSGGFDIVLTLTDDDGTTVSSTFNISTVGTFLTSLAGMTVGAAGTTAGFDFTKVVSANAFISSLGQGDDFALDSVGLLVPAPTTLALLGLGLIGLGLRSRKSK